MALTSRNNLLGKIRDMTHTHKKIVIQTKECVSDPEKQYCVKERNKGFSIGLARAETEIRKGEMVYIQTHERQGQGMQ